MNNRTFLHHKKNNPQAKSNFKSADRLVAHKNTKHAARNASAVIINQRCLQITTSTLKSSVSHCGALKAAPVVGKHNHMDPENTCRFPINNSPSSPICLPFHWPPTQLAEMPPTGGEPASPPKSAKSPPTNHPHHSPLCTKMAANSNQQRCGLIVGCLDQGAKLLRFATSTNTFSVIRARESRARKPHQTIARSQ